MDNVFLSAFVDELEKIAISYRSLGMTDQATRDLAAKDIRRQKKGDPVRLRKQVRSGKSFLKSAPPATRKSILSNLSQRLKSR